MRVRVRVRVSRTFAESVTGDGLVCHVPPWPGAGFSEALPAAQALVGAPLLLADAGAQRHSSDSNRNAADHRRTLTRTRGDIASGNTREGEERRGGGADHGSSSTAAPRECSADRFASVSCVSCVVFLFSLLLLLLLCCVVSCRLFAWSPEASRGWSRTGVAADRREGGRGNRGPRPRTLEPPHHAHATTTTPMRNRRRARCGCTVASALGCVALCWGVAPVSLGASWGCVEGCGGDVLGCC